jgi:DNA-binding response OmpR family regulator
MKSLTPPGGVPVERDAPAKPVGGGPTKLDHISPALVVEDNYFAAVDLTRLLDEWGIESQSTPRIATARELAHEMRPRLALVDINLDGGFEGLALAQELQALYGTKIVFVTGYHVRDLMHRMTEADNMAVLFKPVDREVLAAVLAKVALTLVDAH